MGALGASLVVSKQVYGTDFNFASARSTGVRDRPDLSYSYFKDTHTEIISMSRDRVSHKFRNNDANSHIIIALVEIYPCMNAGGLLVSCYC